jgi:hypothetical protein
MFSDKALSELQRRGGKSRDDAFNAALVEYLLGEGKLGIGPGDMFYGRYSDGSAEVVTWLVPD